MSVTFKIMTEGVSLQFVELFPRGMIADIGPVGVSAINQILRLRTSGGRMRLPCKGNATDDNDQIVELLVTPKQDTVSVINVHAVLRRVNQTRWRDSRHVRGGGFCGRGK